MTYAERLKHRINWIKPRFERTREIEIIGKNGEFTAICSCNHYLKNKFCCRHIYKLIARKPQSSDAAIRWWKCYDLFYGKDKNITKQLKELREKSNGFGIQVLPSEFQHYAVGELEDSTNTNLKFFTCSLNKIKLQAPSYWTKDRNTASGLLPQHENEIFEPIGQKKGAMPPPLSLTQETHLSQVAQECNSSEDEGFCVLGGDISSDEETTTKFCDTNAYSTFHSLYTQITKCVTTSDQMKELNIILHDAHKKMIQMQQNSETTNKTANNSNGMISLPELDKRKKDQRIHGIGSPVKKKSRKK